MRDERSNDAPFVVGVGASAGGLEAISELLGSLPENTGMAVVVVQHLDPKHETQLLRFAVQGHPPAHRRGDTRPGRSPRPRLRHPQEHDDDDRRGFLQLTMRGEGRLPHLPIDLFLKSLAVDRQAAGIGVILSGTGSDGTLGLEELKAAGGITFAQDESSAKYPGMPLSAAGAAASISCCPRPGSPASWHGSASTLMCSPTGRRGVRWVE